MPFKILVVEDNTDSRALLHHLLTVKDYLVGTASDGVEGVYMAKAELPDLIITDLAMPNLGGEELITLLRAEPETAGIPIVVYTAFSSTEGAEAAMKAGANQLFSKPLDLEKMLQFIADSLGPNDT